jgi:enediyne biosynthesis protein E4
MTCLRKNHNSNGKRRTDDGGQRTDFAGHWFLYAIGLVCLIICLSSPVLATIRFTEVTDASGVTFTHTLGASGKYHIVETVTAGLALFDYDRDGDVDIYFLNGAYHDSKPAGQAPCNALYRNEGNWRFEDVTEAAGVGDTGFGLGVAAGDYDNDGDIDLYVNNYGPNVLYRNNGNGSFTDVTASAQVGDGTQMGAGANFLDVDKDGDLDLYVSHYVRCLKDLAEPAQRGGHPAYLGPAVAIFSNTPDTLYRNNGDGSFTDISEVSGIRAATGAGMGTICADYDNDGDTDIIVANDMCANHLLLNDGKGIFEEYGLFAGMAYDHHGEEQGSMGMELADMDNDGWLDLYLTSYQTQWAALYRNMGDGSFEDITLKSGAGTGTLARVTWGSGLVDFDRDGDRDIFVACGHLQPHIETYDNTTTYAQPNILYDNQGGCRFTTITENAGPGLRVNRVSRGIGCDDLDNDGDVDVVILNSGDKATLLRNDTPAPGHWLQVTLRGTGSNRDGVGAQVRVFAKDLMLLDEVHSGRSYQSHYGTRLYFGFGSRTQVDRIEVAWMGGATQIYRPIKVDRHILLVEGESVPRPF